mgnify:CR=1 FL=1
MRQYFKVFLVLNAQILARLLELRLEKLDRRRVIESDYDNGTYKQWSESRQERFLESSLIFLDDDYGYDYIYTKEDVITAAGFLSSGEVGSGAENAVA